MQYQRHLLEQRLNNLDCDKWQRKESIMYHSLHQNTASPKDSGILPLSVVTDSILADTCLCLEELSSSTLIRIDKDAEE